MLPRMWESGREWTSTLLSELPLWELESQLTSEFSKSNCRSQNQLDWNIVYIIRKLLERRCLKWARMTHLDTQNTSYGWKKGWKSNWQFDFWSLKVWNRPNFLTCRWLATYRWKAFDKDYNFATNIISIRGLHTQLWAPKVMRVPTLGILRLPLGSPGTKCNLSASLVARYRVYYKGEGGGFPQVWAVVNLVSPTLPVVSLSIKSVSTSSNQLVVWFMQVRVSDWLSFFLVSSQSSNMPLYPQNVAI
jgi:hypothetical protein